MDNERPDAARQLAAPTLTAPARAPAVIVNRSRGLELHNQLGLTLDSDAPYAEKRFLRYVGDEKLGAENAREVSTEIVTMALPCAYDWRRLPTVCPFGNAQWADQPTIAYYMETLWGIGARRCNGTRMVPYGGKRPPIIKKNWPTKPTVVILCRLLLVPATALPPPPPHPHRHPSFLFLLLLSHHHHPSFLLFFSIQPTPLSTQGLIRRHDHGVGPLVDAMVGPARVD
uniref:Uncharacterized protein n=1 Tax=Oryza glumipatula TaxID=40148 RepID=A0A0D9ZHG6_9ORYZ